MGEKTIIAWTDHTFNIAWGCVKVSPGCKHCYAESSSNRFGFDVWGKNASRRTFGDKHWHEPMKWELDAIQEGRQHRVFCSSMCDVFEDHPTIVGELAKLWDLITLTPHLDWQLLTKRPERIADNLPDTWGVAGWNNVWIGTSIENNDYANRADIIRDIPAVVRFISYEPALGPLDKLDLDGIDWVIFGGESGDKFRAMDVQWARDMRDRCAKARVAYFFKQSAAPRTETGIKLDGVIVRQYPIPRRGYVPSLDSLL